MLRLLFTLIVLFSVHEILQAQSFGGGIIVGMSASQLLGTEIYGFGKPGFIAGVYADKAVSQKSGVQAELIFITKGSRKVYKNEDEGTEFFNLNINYVSLPLLFKSQLRGRFGFDIGLYFSLRLGKPVLHDENGLFPSGDPAARPFNATDFGCLGGFAYRISNKFDASLRYSNSIIPVRKHQFGQTWRLNRGEYNSVIEVTLRYVLKRTGKD